MISPERIQKAISRFHFTSGISLAAFPPSEQSIIRRKSKKLSLKRKSILYRQGSYPQGVYFLKKGKLKVYQLNYDGSVQLLFIYSAEEIFGFRSILSGDYQNVTVAALEDSELLFMDRKHFIELLGKSTFLSNSLFVSLSREFTVLTNRINVFARRSIKERLAFALLILNEKFKIPGSADTKSAIKLPRKDLANFIGTSMENLSRTLNFFREKNLIRTSGKTIYIEHFENLFILSAIGS